uniref:AAA_5 domain-containing protein n=1 Tax=Echinostoma caproni TaxID=27848 RepID=A0A183A2E7_9TREM
LSPGKQLTDSGPTIRSYTLQCNQCSGINNSKVIRYKPLVRGDEEVTRMEFAPSSRSQPDYGDPAAWIHRSNQSNPPSDCEITWFAVVHLDGSANCFMPETGNSNHPSRPIPSESVQLNLLSFETLIPMDLLRDYLRQMREHRLVVLCGPTGTRKTRILHKVAELLVQE